MARRRLPPTATSSIEDPRRRAWTAIGLRIRGWQELPEADRLAWSMAWRRFEAESGPCPVSPAAFRTAMAAWPSRSTFQAVIATRAAVR